MKNVKLSLELSAKSCDKTINQLKALKTSLANVNATYISLALEWLEVNAQMNLNETIGKTGYAPTGKISQSFVKQENTYFGVLKNIDPNSAAVEFGTGEVGNNSAHPMSSEYGYKYNVNGHKDGWIYRDEFGNVWHTKGQVAHRFMYDTLIDFIAQDMPQKLMETAIKMALGGSNV